MRSQRYCQAVVQQSDQCFCSQHLPEALAAARARSVSASAGDGGSRARYRRLESQHLATRAQSGSDLTPQPRDFSWDAGSSLPVHLDIGCARGRWLLEISASGRRFSGLAHHVGVEIRSALVDEANRTAEARGLSDCVRYVAADMARAGPTRDALLAHVAPRLAAVSILFPDPYKPGCAANRGRTLSEGLARALADAMLAGGVVFLSSDVAEVFHDMVAVLSAAADASVGGKAFERLEVGDDAADAALTHALRLRGQPPPSDADRADAGGGGAEAVSSGDASGEDAARAPPLGRNLWRHPTEREIVCEQLDGHGQYRRVCRALFRRRATLQRVQEGSASLAVAAALNEKPGAVSGFYNPVMRLNRELCVHELSAALAAGPWRTDCASCADDDDDDTANDGGEGLGVAGHSVRALDAFAATGALAIRLALEAGGGSGTGVGEAGGRPLEVTAADLDQRCIDLARTNASLSGLRATQLRALLGTRADASDEASAAPTAPCDADASPSAPCNADAPSAPCNADAPSAPCNADGHSAAGGRRPWHSITALLAADEAARHSQLQHTPSALSPLASVRPTALRATLRVLPDARVVLRLRLPPARTAHHRGGGRSPIAPAVLDAPIAPIASATLATPAEPPTHGAQAAASLRLALADARALLYLEPHAYDWSHLDPYGSCCPYLDAFLARCPHGGLLSLTATDTSALYAHYPAVARRLYAAELSRADGCWREAGVRALCGAAATAAARHVRGINVLHATSAAHFVHVLVRVRRGAAAADNSVGMVRMLTTPDGAPLGPMWAGALNAPRFLRRCIAAAAAAEARAEIGSAEANAAGTARVLFQRSLEDAPALPPFSVPTGRVSTARLVAALRARGFHAYPSAFDGDAARPHTVRRVRTDAPAAVLHEVMETEESVAVRSH